MGKFTDAPVFDNGVWPNECVSCGDAITHYGKAKHTKINAEQLLVGALSVSSGSVSKIPYCDRHNNVIGLKIKDDYLRVIFPDFEMMKRYLAVNKGRGVKPIKN